MSLANTLSSGNTQLADMFATKEGESTFLQQKNYSLWSIKTEGLLIKNKTIGAIQGETSPIDKARELFEGGDPEEIKSVMDALASITRASMLAEVEIISRIGASMAFLATAHKKSEFSGDAWRLWQSIKHHCREDSYPQCLEYLRYEWTETAQASRRRSRRVTGRGNATTLGRYVDDLVILYKAQP
jgi:hypothetical protein